MIATSNTNLHFCDFCGSPLFLGGYFVLKDGREQCKECHKTAIDTLEEEYKFINDSHIIIGIMQAYFDIEFNVPIVVDFICAEEMAKIKGKTFIATPNFDERTVALAQKNHYGYTIFIEEGTTEIDAIANFVHELTHIWQYLNWDFNKIKELYGDEDHKIISEGMAEWTATQFMLLLNHEAYTKHALNRLERTLLYENVYGWGLKFFVDEYPLVNQAEDLEKSPFDKKNITDTDDMWTLNKEL
jgi:hypothetical protein